MLVGPLDPGLVVLDTDTALTARKQRGATLTGANGNKAFPSKRPWMISH